MRLSARPLAATLIAGGVLGLAPLAPASARPVPAAPPLTTASAGTTSSSPSGVTAKGAYLYDASAGKKLWGRYTTTKRSIGSITKVMTALVVIRAGDLDRTITIKQSYIDHARKYGGSTASLRAGDKLTARQLLYGTMLPSGCDAAYALADVYGSGNSAFVTKMNRQAAALNMTGTLFRTSDGLPTSTGKEGYSTPRDLMLLARYAMKSKTFRALVSRQTYSLSATSAHKSYSWTNTNLLLGSYSGATGIKTGHTDAAGYCLLFSAVRGGRTLIGVVLYSTNTDANRRFQSAAHMLDWGFGGTTAMSPLRLRSLPAGAATD